MMNRPDYINHIICPQVGYDEADLGVTSFACSQARSTVVDCSQPTRYGPYHWVSRAPRPVLPITGLLRIFDTDCWLLIIISMVAVNVFLVIAGKMGRYYNLGFTFEEIVLFPFR